MDKKNLIREKYFLKRKKHYFEIKKTFFLPLIALIKKMNYKNKTNISLYYPSNFEVNVLKILDIDFFKKFKFSLPVIKKNQEMHFCRWQKEDILLLNQYGIPEPRTSQIINPKVILIPLLAFDINKNRVGYGKGYYDRFLNANILRQKKFLTVGIAFSFQKHQKLPVNNKDFKLDYIITEKGIL